MSTLQSFDTCMFQLPLWFPNKYSVDKGSTWIFGSTVHPR